MPPIEEGHQIAHWSRRRGAGRSVARLAALGAIRPMAIRAGMAQSGGKAPFPICPACNADLESSHSTPEAATPHAARRCRWQLGIAHDNLSGNRQQGMPVASRREWYRDRADILDFTSTVNGSPESIVFVGGVWVLTEKRYSVRFARYLLRTGRLDSSTRSSVTPAQRQPMRPQRPRSLPTARATTARPRSAMLLGSAEGRLHVPIGRIVMAPR